MQAMRRRAQAGIQWALSKRDPKQDALHILRQMYRLAAHALSV